MFLVMLPAVDGLRPAWREAVANLGGTAATYWRRVGIPVLAPAALGGMLLLFANAFAAYATAFALSTGSSKLVSVQIRFFLQGNTITGKANLGYALAAWMIVADAGDDRRLPAAAAPSGTVAAMNRKALGTALSWVFLVAVLPVLPVPPASRWPASPSSACRRCCSAGRRCSTSGRSTP